MNKYTIEYKDPNGLSKLTVNAEGKNWRSANRQARSILTEENDNRLHGYDLWSVTMWWPTHKPIIAYGKRIVF